MKKRVIILGSTGMLGHQVYHHLKSVEKYQIIDVAFRNKLNSQSIILDLSNRQELEKLLYEVAPDYIINCVGVLINGAHANPANAIYLNSYLPHLLAQISDKISAKLIHISTDCVFSGEKGNYVEKDEKDGKDIYSKTKALGEVESSSHLTLRTSIIGPELKNNGEGLFHWFMGQTGSINGYDKAIWSGVTTIQLAKIIEFSMNFNLAGLHHVTNNEKIKKYELLMLFKDISKKDISINSIEGKPVDKSLINTKGNFEGIIPSYKDMVLEMISFIRRNIQMYPHYSDLKA